VDLNPGAHQHRIIAEHSPSFQGDAVPDELAYARLATGAQKVYPSKVTRNRFFVERWSLDVDRFVADRDLGVSLRFDTVWTVTLEDYAPLPLPPAGIQVEGAVQAYVLIHKSWDELAKEMPHGEMNRLKQMVSVALQEALRIDASRMNVTTVEAVSEGTEVQVSLEFLPGVGASTTTLYYLMVQQWVTRGTAIHTGSWATYIDISTFGSASPPGGLAGQVEPGGIVLFQCADGKMGINFCSDWCNVRERWGCSIAALYANDIRNSENQDYWCDCMGCNGCTVRGESSWEVEDENESGSSFGFLVLAAICVVLAVWAVAIGWRFRQAAIRATKAADEAQKQMREMQEQSMRARADPHEMANPSTALEASSGSGFVIGRSSAAASTATFQGTPGGASTPYVVGTPVQPGGAGSSTAAASGTALSDVDVHKLGGSTSASTTTPEAPVPRSAPEAEGAVSAANVSAAVLAAADAATAAAPADTSSGDVSTPADADADDRDGLNRQAMSLGI